MANVVSKFYLAQRKRKTQFFRDFFFVFISTLFFYFSSSLLCLFVVEQRAQEVTEGALSKKVLLKVPVLLGCSVQRQLCGFFRRASSFVEYFPIQYDSKFKTRATLTKLINGEILVN